jgi:hypothetical protein
LATQPQWAGSASPVPSGWPGQQHPAAGGGAQAFPPRLTPPPRPGPDGPRRGEPRRRRRAVWPFALTAVLLVVGGAAAAVLLLHPFGAKHPRPAASGETRHNASRPLSVSSTASPPPGGSSPSAGSSAPAGTPAVTEQEAAQNLARLLARSVSDRSAVVQASNDVGSCGPNLNRDVQTFQNASGSRQRLLAKLAMLPGASKLPAGLLQSLTGAWQASQQADQDFATWAQDEMTNGCTPSDHADPGYQSARGPDQQATTDKKAFAGAWDPIANQYGLTAYRQAQL